jgi:1-acyl-sn-glycerol-3-phosphate acyltransferase
LKKFQSIYSNLLYWFGRKVIDLYALIFLKLNIVKHSNKFPKGPKIISPNHPTTSDPFIITKIIDERITMLITKGAFDVPIFGSYLRKSGHICVPYYDSKFNGRTVYKQAKSSLKQGKNVVIFPEGRLSVKFDQLLQAKTGAVRLALETGVPIIPVGISLDVKKVITLTWNIRGQIEEPRWYFKGPYEITVGKPIYLKGDVNNRSYVRSSSKKLRAEIKKLLTISQGRIKNRT